MRNIGEPAKSKMAARGPQNGRRVLESVLPLGFDLSTPSMRKGRDGEKNGEKMEKKNNGENRTL